MRDIGYTSYQDPRLDPESWHNNGGIKALECELCGHYSYEGEYTDIGNVCQDCFDDNLCVRCGDFTPPEYVQFINDENGKPEILCENCMEDYINE